MTVRFGWLAAAAFIVLATSIATSGAGQDQTTAPPQDEDAFGRAGEELLEKVCTECHGLEDITRLRRTAREWSDMVTSMATRGANATDDQFATIEKYLTRYYGIVAVNTASAQELSAVLGLSSKDANAIVDYRQAHGKFADIDALAKVPGIDKTKLEAQPDALRFD